MKIGRIVAITVAVFAVCIATGIAGYYAGKKYVKNNISQNENINQYEQESDQNSYESQSVSLNTAKISPSTKMVYQYYYKDTKSLTEYEDTPAYFLIDLTLEDMKKYYNQWSIVKFSEKEVVMRKIMEHSPSLIVGQRDGVIAVFYDEDSNGRSLREYTDIPVAGLPEEEKELLDKGIVVKSEEELASVLADYGS